MKKALILVSLFLITASPGMAQLFEVNLDVPVRRADSSLLAMPFAGGMNQPQFSSIDLNSDGSADIFVFDRTGETKIAFISDKKGGYFYDPSYAAYFPNLNEYMFLHDYNGDGLPDIWGYNKQESNAQLYTNIPDTNPKFVLKQNLRAYNFDNPPFDSSSFIQFNGNFPDVVDMDNDGDMDFVSNLNYCGTSLTLYCNNTVDKGRNLNDIGFVLPDYCLGNLGEDGITVTIDYPCLYARNYNHKKHCGVKTLGFFDNDGDGDKDLFFGSSEQPSIPIYFIENGKSDLGMDIDTFISIDTNYFSQAIQDQIPPSPGSSFIDVDHDGIYDLLLSTNEKLTFDYPVHEINNVCYFKNKGTNSVPDFDFVQNDFLGNEMIDHGGHTAPALADLNGDGLLDLIIATNGSDHLTNNKTHYLVYYKNIGTVLKPSFILEQEETIIFKSDSLKSFIPTFYDIDNDNDLDLFLGMADGNIRYYKNEGSSSTPNFVLNEQNYQSIYASERAAPFFYDVDNDGLVDLLLGDYNGNIHYYNNTGTAASPAFTLAQDTLGGILVNELIQQTIIDPDRGLIDTLLPNYFGLSTVGAGLTNDSLPALFLGGAEGKVRVYLIPDDLDSPFVENTYQTIHSGLNSSSYIYDWGSDINIGVGDLNGDGYIDVMAGNSRGGVHYLESRSRLSIPLTYAKTNYDLFPNPSKGLLQLSLPQSFRTLNYNIIDLSGRTVQQGSLHRNQTIRLAQSLANGMYFIQLDTKGYEFSTKKFVLYR